MRTRLREVEVDQRMPAMHPLEKRVHIDDPQALLGAHPQSPGQLARRPPDGIPCSHRVRQHGSRMGQQRATGVGRFDAAGRAIEQRRSQLVLEAADGGRQPRLRDTAQGSGPRELLLIGERHEVLHLTKVHSALQSMNRMSLSCWTYSLALSILKAQPNPGRTPVQQRNLGPRTVSALGLGGMPMSVEGRPDAERSIATIHAAIGAGLTLIDTADSYHRDAGEVGHNETLIAEALRTYPGDTSEVLVATKGGHLRPGDGTWTKDGRPEYIKKAAKASAQRLGVDAIGLYQFHRPDPRVPYADSVGALRDLLDDGVIQLAGISNASVSQIDEANEILGGRLVSVQNQFSPAFRSSLSELEHCASSASRSFRGRPSAASPGHARSAHDSARFSRWPMRGV